MLILKEFGFASKRKGQTWKEAYLRKLININKNMRGMNKDERLKTILLQYEMCPIREHKAIIKQAEIFGNLSKLYTF